MVELIEYHDLTGSKRFFYFDPEQVPPDLVEGCLNLTDSGAVMKGCLNVSEKENILLHRLVEDILKEKRDGNQESDSSAE